MVGRIRSLRSVAELEIDDLSQEIDEPLGDRQERGDEATLTKMDFEDNDIAVDGLTSDP